MATRAESLQASAAADNHLNRHSNTTMVAINASSSSSHSPSHSVSHPGPSSSLPTTDLPSNSISSLDHHDNSTVPSAPTHSNARRSLWDRCINSEIGRLVASVVYFAVVCIGMAFCNQFSDHRWVKTDYTGILLKDRGFDIFPALSDDTPANIFVMTSIVFTLIAMALICPTWTARIIVLRRVLWVVGTLSVYRALTLSVTTLPSPKYECDPATKTGFGSMFWIALQMIPGTVEACTDDIFSGHTVFMVTCAIQWRLYCRNKWATYLSYIYITVGLYFVIATRLHYTVDVVLAIFITYAVWSLYISMIDVVMEKEYFGLRRHREKYTIFDSYWSDAEEREQRNGKSLANDESEKENITVSAPESTGSRFAEKRAQLEHTMNRMRGAGIGYDRGEHDRVAFVPMQYNIWLIGAIRWCDGLDIRMRENADRSSGSRWEELVVDRQSKRHSGSDLSESYLHQKPEGTEVDLEAGQGRREMVQVGHGRDATAGPMMLDSIHIVSHADEVSSAAGTR